MISIKALGRGDWEARCIGIGSYVYVHSSGASLSLRASSMFDDEEDGHSDWWLYQTGYSPELIRNADQANRVVAERTVTK